MANRLFAKRELTGGQATAGRTLGPLALTSLGVGGIIGTGIFIMTGMAARQQAGPALILSFLIAGLACVTAALCYAEFAAMVPVVGSAYTYAYVTLGELPAWMVGWNLILQYGLAAASVAQGWSHYFQEFIGIFGLHLPSVLNHSGGGFDLSAFLIVLLLTGIIAKGLRLSLTFNNVMVAVKMAVILFVIVLGAFYVHPANWQPFAPFGFGFTFPAKGGDPTGVLAGAAFAFYAYLGFDSMTNYTEETVRPQRTVPLSILVSMAICTVLYIAMTAVLTGMVPYQQIQMNAPVSAAFRQVGLPWAQLLIAGGALVGITSVLLVILMSLPRILLAIGRDGLLPTGFFTGLHPRTGTPWRSILATGIVIALLSSLAPLQDLTFFVVLSTLCGFIVVAVAVLVLRRTAPDAVRPFRVPLGPVLPLVSIAVCLLLAVALPPVNIVRLSAWLALGLVIYFAYSRHHSRLLIDREK